MYKNGFLARLSTFQRLSNTAKNACKWGASVNESTLFVQGALPTLRAPEQACCPRRTQKGHGNS
jgi:hypothetical protein